MRKTRKRRLMSDINVVPYIDVMLVLLVIFMVTAPLLTQVNRNAQDTDRLRVLPWLNHTNPSLDQVTGQRFFKGSHNVNLLLRKFNMVDRQLRITALFSSSRPLHDSWP